MKILLVSQFYPPDTGGGGIAVYARNLALGLTIRGHEVRVVSRSVSGFDSFQVVEGIPVLRTRCPFASYRWSRIPVLGRHMRFLRNIVYAWRVRTKLQELATDWVPDIVEYGDVDAEALFHPHVAPYAVRLHGTNKALRPFYGKKEHDYWRKGIELLESKAIRRADGLSAPSQWFRDQIVRLERIDADRIDLTINPLDTDFFTPGKGEPPGGSLSIL